MAQAVKKVPSKVYKNTHTLPTPLFPLKAEKANKIPLTPNEHFVVFQSSLLCRYVEQQ